MDTVMASVASVYKGWNRVRILRNRRKITVKTNFRQDFPPEARLEESRED